MTYLVKIHDKETVNAQSYRKVHLLEKLCKKTYSSSIAHISALI